MSKLKPSKAAPKAKAAPPARALDLPGSLEPDFRPIARVPDSTGPLNLRADPSTNGAILRTLAAGALLLVRDLRQSAVAKIGAAGQWLPVVTWDGLAGYVAAPFVELLPGEAEPPRPPVDPQIVAQGVALAGQDIVLNTPAGAWAAPAGAPVQVLDGASWDAINSGASTQVRVRTFAFKEGSVPASQLRAPASPDRRAGVMDANLAVGDGAWLYGMHDPYDRGLIAADKGGWVLFTSRVDEGVPDYASWAQAGYGVMARLNNDYGGSGTVPVPALYDTFAARCADFVRRSNPQPPPTGAGCRIWIIGNEMNNPGEWPNQNGAPGSNPGQQITPESYADCFNRVRAAIKAADPNAQVIPGAVDPYNAAAGDCRDWFRRMLNAIGDLDGLALHCYTHGPNPASITDLGAFGNDPLRWQYYHFRCYTTFMELIPAKWRSRPVYITETNATPDNGQPAWTGGQNGWVQAAYREIDRWNAQPQAQQIRALLLYRWIRGGGSDGQFAISEKPGVQADFRSTVSATDYRWRA